MNDLIKELRQQGYKVETPFSFRKAFKESLRTFWLTKMFKKLFVKHNSQQGETK